MGLFSVLLSSATTTVGQNMSFWQRIAPPEDISKEGHLIDFLFNMTTGLVIFYFILVCLGLFGFSYFYSSKKHPKALYTHGNKKNHKMITFAIAAAVFLSVDLNIAHMAGRDYKEVFINFPKKGADVVQVEVLAQQWAWNFRYAGKDGVFNTDDDIVTLNDLRVPVGKKLIFQVLSKDVIHSFFVANTRRKVDAIPGRVTRMWFELTKTGNYEIACAEMCGTHHYKMRATMTVYTQDDFDKWMNSAQTKSLAVADIHNSDNFWGWQWEE